MSCMELCKLMPETRDRDEWRIVMVEQYVHCAVLHNQCRKALMEK